MVGSLYGRDVHDEADRDHFVLEIPASSSGQLNDDIVAIPYELDVEVDVLDFLSGDVDVRNRMGQVIGHLAHRGDLERGAYDDDEVRLLREMCRERKQREGV